MARLLLVPHLGTAEDEVLVLEWLVKPDEAFHKGQALLVLETLKASFEVEAEEEGVLLEILATEGDRLAIHGPLGILGQCGERMGTAERETLLTDAKPVATSSMDAVPDSLGTGGPVGAGAEHVTGLAPAAPAARRRAAELGVDLTGIQGTGPSGMIRVEDVEQAAPQGSGARTQKSAGMVDAALLVRIRHDETAFGALDSAEKLDLYRQHGAQIEADCRLGRGSVILAERLVLGVGVTIESDCRIEARDFEVGAGSHFGDRCRVRCRRVRLGENAYFVTDIEIGGGGAMDPEASLELGSHGFVGEHVHLNPCRPMRIGDEVVISRNASLMTHSFGLDVLQGFPNRFAGIVIEDECQIGIGAVLFPGVSMGRGSILLSCSSLVTDLPAGRLFGGIPAKDIKAAARDLSPEQKQDLVENLIREFARQLTLRGFVCDLQEGIGDLELQVETEAGVHVLRFANELPARETKLTAEDLRVGLVCADEDWAGLAPEFCAMDLGQKRLHGQPGSLGLAFREYLRKHGIRLSPRNWTYGGGWL